MPSVSDEKRRENGRRALRERRRSAALFLVIYLALNGALAWALVAVLR